MARWPLRAAILIAVMLLITGLGSLVAAFASSGSANFQNNPTEYCADYLSEHDTTLSPDRWDAATATVCPATNTVVVEVDWFDSNGTEHVGCGPTTDTNGRVACHFDKNPPTCPSQFSPCFEHQHSATVAGTLYAKAFFSWQSSD